MKIRKNLIHLFKNMLLNENTAIEGMIGLNGDVVCDFITFSDFYLSKSDTTAQFENVIENKLPRKFENIGYVYLCKKEEINIKKLKERILRNSDSFVLCLLSTEEIKCYIICDNEYELYLKDEKIEIIDE